MEYKLSLRTHITNPVRGVLGGSLQFSYTHSSFRSNLAGGLGDQDLLPLAADFNHPTTFFGSASQDRKNQFSVGSVLDLPRGIRLGVLAYLASPLPQTLFLPASGGVPGEIFRTDVTGDGSFGGQSQTGASSYGDILPGGNIGSFGRDIKASKLNTIIQNYNTNFADQLTSAGQSLVNAGLAFQIATAAVRRSLAGSGGGSARKRKSGVGADSRLDPGPSLPHRRPLCGRAQRVGVQCS